MFQGVHHVGYLTDDVDKAVGFFQESFGGVLFNSIVSPEGNKTAFVTIGKVEVEIIEPADRSRLGGKTGLVIDHVGWLVEDLEQSRTGLIGKGIKFAAPARSGSGRVINYMDVSSTLGTKIHLTQM